MFWQSASPARPQEGIDNALWPKTGQDWQLGRLEMARLADAGCSRHTTLLRKILAPRVLTGMASASPYPDLLGILQRVDTLHYFLGMLWGMASVLTV